MVPILLPTCRFLFILENLAASHGSKIFPAVPITEKLIIGFCEVLVEHYIIGTKMPPCNYSYVSTVCLEVRGAQTLLHTVDNTVFKKLMA